MENITRQYNNLVHSLPHDTTLVAVSKFHPTDAILQVYHEGHRDFGESYVNELLSKHELLPRDIRWHFIGHLQRNKVKHIAPFVHLIHSIDSPRLLLEVNRQAERCGRVIDCLFELHLAQETTKSGFTPTECIDFLSTFHEEDYPNIRCRGIMTMATNTNNTDQIAHEFSLAQEYFLSIKQQFFPHTRHFNLRSWGMSDDYTIALAHEANLLRIGTKIFGERT